MHICTGVCVHSFSSLVMMQLNFAEKKKFKCEAIQKTSYYDLISRVYDAINIVV